MREKKRFFLFRISATNLLYVYLLEKRDTLPRDEKKKKKKLIRKLTRTNLPRVSTSLTGSNLSTCKNLLMRRTARQDPRPFAPIVKKDLKISFVNAI